MHRSVRECCFQLNLLVIRASISVERVNIKFKGVEQWAQLYGWGICCALLYCTVLYCTVLYCTLAIDNKLNKKGALNYYFYSISNNKLGIIYQKLMPCRCWSSYIMYDENDTVLAGQFSDTILTAPVRWVAWFFIVRTLHDLQHQADLSFFSEEDISAPRPHLILDPLERIEQYFRFQMD